MLTKTVLILLPIFVIVGLGYLSGRFSVLGDEAASTLARFVTQISMPALLFGALAKEPLSRVFDLPFVVSFGGAALIAFILPSLILRRGKHELSQQAMRGMGASFAAVTFVGIPVLTPLIGSLALPAVGVANIIALIVMAIALFLLEMGRSTGGFLRALWTALLHTFKNPIVLGMIAGLAYSISGLALPEWIDRTTGILGDATPPVALFALGLALVRMRLGHFAEVGVITAIKLVAMPLITLGLLMLFPAVDKKWAVAAVILAAMSTTALEYIIAEQYQTYAQEASGVVLFSTILSAVTLPIFIIVGLHLWPID